MTLLRSPRRAWTLAQTLSALLLPHGGQAVARRNAWSGMVRDAQLTRDRSDAEAAMTVAAHRAAAASTFAREASGR